MASIIQLLEEIGLDNIGVQQLHQCMSNSNLGQHKSKLTIETEELTTANTKIEGGQVKMNKTALICWVDSDKFDAALAKLTKG